MSIDEEVKEIISKRLEINIEEIDDKASLIDDLGADSLDIVELIMTMEDKFGVEISDEDVEEIQTIRDAIEYIKKHISTEEGHRA